MKKIFVIFMCLLFVVPLVGCSNYIYSLEDLLGESYSVNKIERLEIADKPYSSQLTVINEDNDIKTLIGEIAKKGFIKRKKEYIENNFNISNSCIIYIFFDNEDYLLIYSKNNQYLININDEYYLTK